MIKNASYYFIAFVLLFGSCTSETKKYDERAIDYLDNLSATIGEINSCSYTLNAIISEDNETEIIKEHDVYMRGPNKMHIYTTGTEGRKGIWYDGSVFAYFSYDKNVFDTIAAPGDIITTINEIHDKYGIYFPASDFFYPTLTDDLIDNFNEVLFGGDENLDGVDCVVVEASRKDRIVYIWIEKESYLPHKMMVNQIGGLNRSYEALFSNWRINPNLPDILFEFEPPANSTREKIQPKKNK